MLSDSTCSNLREILTSSFMEVEDSNNYFNLGLDNDTIIQSETINLVEVNTNASKPQAFVRVPDEESKKKKKI